VLNGGIANLNIRLKLSMSIGFASSMLFEKRLAHRGEEVPGTLSATCPTLTLEVSET
jgi:hypothetical protein